MTTRHTLPAEPPARPGRRHAMTTAAGLALGVAVGSTVVAGSAAAAKSGQALSIRIRNAKGDATATVPLTQFTHVTFEKGQSVGLRATLNDGTGDIEVMVSRATTTRPPEALHQADFSPSQRLVLRSGAPASLSLAQGVTISLAGAAVAGLDSAAGDCTCCVTCDNGVTICGCKVRSSCGNCG